MRPLRFSINITLDGCSDHTAGIADEALHHYHAASIAANDALLVGRVTYQMMEEAWRLSTRMIQMPAWTDEFAHTMDRARKYVVSSTLRSVDWNAELVRGDLATAVQQLKAQPGRGIAVAGIQLAQSLTELGLIDEYDLVIHPRLAGRGPHLFAGLSKFVDLELVGQHPLGNGAIALRYVPKR